MTNDILVTGGTGFAGHKLVADLIADNFNIVVLARQKSSVESLRRMGAEIRYGDITNLRSLIEACKGIGTVVHLAASTSSKGADYETSFMVNVVGTQNVIDACKVNGIRKIIYMGTQSDNPGAYATTKRQAEKLLQDSGLEVITLKPSLIYGPGGQGLFGDMVSFIEKMPVIPIVGSGKYPMKPIYVGDVANVTSSCLKRDNLKTEYFISGPEEIYYKNFLDFIGNAMGLKTRKIHIPYWIVFAGVAIVCRIYKGFPITADTLRGLVNPKVYDSNDAERDLDFRPVSLEKGLRLTFANGRGGE
ncbi:MAG: NAD-dependent epimerase/dehydratase family protein [Chloroflexi bacterium]|nr:NAD-dependent epimerase/dehydratase family protein [Chloroflexota bacterium]